MKYTVRYAHLAERPNLIIGQPLEFGELIGRMGTTGQSKWPHLHIDVVEDFVVNIIRLKEIGPDKKYKPDKRQLNFFLDFDLFKFRLVKTTKYLSKKYEEKFGKKHHACDVVPADRHRTKKHFNIYWNRKKVKNVEVIGLGYDQRGYGYYALIGYETL